MTRTAAPRRPIVVLPGRAADTMPPRMPDATRDIQAPPPAPASGKLSVLEAIRAGQPHTPAIHGEMARQDHVLEINDFSLWYGKHRACTRSPWASRGTRSPRSSVRPGAASPRSSAPPTA